MAIKLHRGKTKIMLFEGDTAEEVRDGSLITATDSGTAVPARNDSLDMILGVARRNDTTTDSSFFPVEVPVESGVEWLIDLDSDAGAADSDVFRYVNVDTSGGNLFPAGDCAATRADISDSVAGQIFVTRVVSATQVIGVIANMAFHQTFDT